MGSDKDILKTVTDVRHKVQIWINFDFSEVSFTRMTTYYLLIIFYVSFLYVTKGRLFNNYFLIFTFVFDTLTPSKMQTFQFLELYYMKKKKKRRQQPAVEKNKRTLPTRTSSRFKFIHQTKLRYCDHSNCESKQVIMCHLLVFFSSYFHFFFFFAYQILLVFVYLF